MVDSRRKGASAEREVAGLIALHIGVKLKRNLEQTRGGGHDLVEDGEDQNWPIALEIKNYAEARPGQISQWWEQTTRQAAIAKQIPCLWYKDRRRWRVVLPGNLFMEGVDWGTIEAYTVTVSPEMFYAIYREKIIEGLLFDSAKDV